MNAAGMKTRSMKERDEWVSPSNLYHYMATQDPILDVFQVIDKTCPSLNILEPRTPFENLLMHQGFQFESKIYEHLQARFGSDFVHLGHTYKNFFDSKALQETAFTLEKGVPLISQALLMDPGRKIYGFADLLVRVDFLPLLVDQFHEIIPSIPVPYDHGVPYVVVDIKFSTLKLRTDGSLSNIRNQKYYKAQTYMYSQMLGHLMKATPSVAFIMGRRIADQPNCFHALAPIRFHQEPSLAAEVEQGIQWVRTVRSQAFSWFKPLLKGLIPHPLLVPNMNKSSRGDSLKRSIAIQQGETSLYYKLGSSHRDLLRSQGLTMKDGVQALNVLDLPRDHDTKVYHQLKADPLLPDKDTEIHLPDTGRFVVSVDFETTSEILEDFSTFPIAQQRSYLSMIGISWYDQETQKDYHTSFVLRKRTDEDEYSIIQDFIRWIQVVQPIYLLHWGQAERTIWERMRNRHALPEPTWTWLDLQKTFQKYSIVPQGCYGFDLKGMTHALRRHGFLSKSFWQEDPAYKGADAMVSFYRVQQNMKEEDEFWQFPEVQACIQYNQDDCDAVLALYHFLHRTYQVVSTTCPI